MQVDFNEVDGVAHKSLKHLANFEAGLTSQEVFQQLPTQTTRFLSLADLVTDLLSVMQQAGMVLYQDSRWYIAPAGLNLLSRIDSIAEMQSSSRLTVAAKKEYKPNSVDYDGAELKVTCLRPGAYDYLSKPSRIGDEFFNHPTAHLSFN